MQYGSAGRVTIALYPINGYTAVRGEKDPFSLIIEGHELKYRRDTVIAPPR